jgi:hypothetical protein
MGGRHEWKDIKNGWNEDGRIGKKERQTNGEREKEWERGVGGRRRRKPHVLFTATLTHTHTNTHVIHVYIIDMYISPPPRPPLLLPLHATPRQPHAPAPTQVCVRADSQPAALAPSQMTTTGPVNGTIVVAGACLPFLPFKAPFLLPFL